MVSRPQSFSEADDPGADGVEDAAMEQYQIDHHDEIEAKLQVAREQIARGEVEEINRDEFLKAVRERLPR